MKVSKREPLPDGGERVTVMVEPSRIQRTLLRVDSLSRRYELDARWAMEVLALCDGQKTVRSITETFAKRHKIHPHEAERAVAMFLQTMIRKGLIVVVVVE